MANTSLISTVFSARLLDQFKTGLVFGNLVNGDFSGDAANNKIVKINSVTAPVVAKYTPESTISFSPVSASSQDLTIDQYDFFAQSIDKVIAGQTVVNASLLTSIIDLGAYSHAKAVDTYLASTLFGGVDSGNLIESASISASTDAYDYIVKLGQKLDEADVPEVGRFVVVSSAFKGLLQKDSRVTLATSVLTTGQVPMINGMSVYMSNNLPKTGNYTNIIASVQSACTFAPGLKDLSVLDLENTFGQGIKSLLVYGAKVVQPTGIAVFPVIVA